MKILLVDDHEPLCVALARYISDEAPRLLGGDTTAKLDVTPVFTLADAIIAIRAEPAPDLVLLDLGLGGESSGVATLERFQAANVARIPVAIFTGLDPADQGAADTLRKCLKDFGARGILLKSGRTEKMLVGLGRILHGEPWLPEALLMAMLEPPGPSRGADPRLNLGLTKREWDVAQLLAKGLQNKAIARELGLAPGHVSQLVTVILSKLQVQNRTQAALRLKEADSDLA